MSVTFLLTSFVIVATPGTGALLSIAAGLNRGMRYGVLAAFGSTLGVLPHAIAAIGGLAAVLAASPVAFAILKYAGVAYLLYLAWGMWRDTSPLTAEQSPASVRKVLRDGVVLNLLNPKLTAFFFAFLPQFVPADSPGAVGEMVLLSAVFSVMTFVVFAAYAVAAASVRSRLLDRPGAVRGARRVFALSFVALSVRLATA
ncbi:LysE family transporter [Epidermidibacterium keratini]|uniref:LysE family transporter n=1 Tax=Epidermidibacterium keratini TaxID=1891644 RepID=A0A7L4YI32_9ACTN|nr:LysE family translocator [Epidermidibacterium keratini]QHB98917.1 LysE family transporter [Epidermidibacterium keratini]